MGGKGRRGTHQKILAELTGVGVNRNIFVFRRCSLVPSESTTHGKGIRTDQLVSVQEKRNANIVLHPSASPRPIHSIDLLSQSSLSFSSVRNRKVRKTYKELRRRIVICPSHERDKVQHPKEPFPCTPLQPIQGGEREPGGERSRIDGRGECDEDG